jgi:hypothetical protein
VPVAVLRIGLWRAWIVFTRRPWAFSISIGLLLAQLLASGSAAYVLVLVLAVAGTVKELADIGFKVREHFLAVKAAKPVFRSDPMLLPYKSPYDSWRKINLDGGEAIHDPVLDAELASDRTLPFDAKREMWRPTGKNEEVRALKVSTLAFDEDKVRLSSDLVAGVDRVQLQRTSYSAFLVTNRLATCEYREKDALHELIEFPDGPAAGLSHLPRLPMSNCSNHIGVDVLAVADGKILLQRQTSRNELSKDLVAGSGSGSADWRDLEAPRGWRSLWVRRPAPRCSDLLEFARYAMWREMVEEMGLVPADQHGPEDIKVVGYARVTSLGGKPQFYGVASLGRVTTRVTGKDKLFTFDHRTVDFDPYDGVPGLLVALDEVERRYHGQLSFPLHMNIQLIRQWLARDPAAAAAWLKLS